MEYTKYIHKLIGLIIIIDQPMYNLRQVVKTCTTNVFDNL